MGVRDFQDLVCWQLSHQLKCEVTAFIALPRCSRDFKFCDQVRDSSASAPRNISEGFGYFEPGEFARFLGYAKGSLAETRNHLIDAFDHGYIDEALFSRLTNLARAAEKATTNLMLRKQEQHRQRRRRPRSTNP